MDLLASLTNALSQSSTLLGGLLSQMGGTAGAASLDNLFSDLVAQTTATQTASAGSFVATPATSIAPTTTLSSGDDTADNPSSSDTANAIQAVGDITTILHKILYVLHQQNNASGSQNNNQTNSAGQTQDANNQNTNQNATGAQSASANDTAAAAGTAQDGSATNADTGDASSSPATQTLAEIVAELLLAMQAIIKNLQQIQIAKGGADPAQTVTALAAANIGQNNIAGANNPATDTNATAQTPEEKALAEIWSLLGAAANPQGTQAAASAGQNAPDDAMATDPLLAALKLVEKSALEFMTAGAAASENNVAGSSGDIATKLAQIEGTLKDALAHLQNNTTATLQNVAPVKDATAQVSADKTALQTNDTPVAPLAGTQTATAAVQTAVNPAAANTPAANPATTAAQTVAALAADAKLANDSGAGADLNSGGNGFSSSASLNANPIQNVTAEGVQAAGTYNFASTLSAFRAANGGALGLPGVVDQVILQMNRNVKSGNDQMSLQLQPGDLGKITVKLNFGTDGKVQGTVTADNPHTLSMLQKDSRSLERALQDAGLHTDPGSLQFSLGQGQQNGGQTAAGNNTGTAGSNGTLTAESEGEAPLVDIGALAETYYITPTGVNIQV